MSQEKIPAYRKEYKVRTIGKKGTAYEVSFPQDVIEQKARVLGISTEEFLEQYRAVAYYNAFDGVFYRFEPVAVNNFELPSIIGSGGNNNKEGAE